MRACRLGQMYAELMFDSFPPRGHISVAHAQRAISRYQTRGRRFEYTHTLSSCPYHDSSLMSASKQVRT
eukprot:SAG11_NODE_2858_length_2900_cov_1.881471_3_plen_69_part_00